MAGQYHDADQQGSSCCLPRAPLAVKAFTNITMLIVAIWLWRRPEPNQIIIQQNTVDPEKTDLPTAPSEDNQLNPIKPNKIESENNKS